ncbi:hypothetical protein [Paenibacillus algorifonticola]|nr:hypothetical protein [Paenibacillus algorifonticola]
MEKSNIFKKILAIMGLLLIPIIGLYSYSNQISIKVVEEQIRQNSGDKLSFFVQQIDAEFDQYMISVNNLAIEPLVRAFITLPSSSTNSELFEAKLSVQEDLEIKGKAGILQRAYTLYAPRSGEVVSTHGSISYKQMFVDTVHKGELKPFIWTYSVEDNSRIPNAFVYRIVEPLFVYEELEQALATLFYIMKMTPQSLRVQRTWSELMNCCLCLRSIRRRSSKGLFWHRCKIKSI